MGVRQCPKAANVPCKHVGRVRFPRSPFELAAVAERMRHPSPKRDVRMPHDAGSNPAGSTSYMPTEMENWIDKECLECKDGIYVVTDWGSGSVVNCNNCYSPAPDERLDDGR
jgi:hypothetical protein